MDLIKVVFKIYANKMNSQLILMYWEVAWILELFIQSDPREFVLLLVNKQSLVW